MLSFEQLQVIIDAEKERVRLRAQNGEAGVDSRKRRGSIASLVAANVFGQESFDANARRSAADTIDLAFIRWGGSQKVQTAGVRPLGAFDLCVCGVVAKRCTDDASTAGVLARDQHRVESAG